MTTRNKRTIPAIALSLGLFFGFSTAFQAEPLPRLQAATASSPCKHAASGGDATGQFMHHPAKSAAVAAASKTRSGSTESESTDKAPVAQANFWTQQRPASSAGNAGSQPGAGPVPVSPGAGATPLPAAEPNSTTTQREVPAITPEYASRIAGKVDKIVRERFYDPAAVQTVWSAAWSRHRPAIESAGNLLELSAGINAALSELKVSHTQFVTVNDETYYFLHTLFGQHRSSKLEKPDMDFTGAITGGAGEKFDVVRYVLDGSPAQEAGIKPGDRIVSVNGAPYYGQLSFARTHSQPVQVTLERNGSTATLSLTPVKKNAAEAYVEAIEKSVTVKRFPEGKIGYIHLWSGGSQSHDAFEEQLARKKLQNTDGLILDLRDGYGGNHYDDLDFFYRLPQAYPLVELIDHREGRRRGQPLYYDKPVVALINGGVRSGKELLALSLQRTGRAKLVGQKTAGAVLAGSLFPLDERCTLYLAVTEIVVGGMTLEGTGVQPDVEVPLTATERGNADVQLARAQELLRSQLAQPGFRKALLSP